MTDNDLARSFGSLLVQKIIREDLKFLNIDNIILNDNVIDVTVEENQHFKKLDQNWKAEVNNKDLQSPEAKSAWDELLSFRKKMEKKYLPKLKVEIEVPYFEIGKYKRLLFRYINYELWDCDASHYLISSVNDIKFETLFEDSYKILCIELNTEFTNPITPKIHT